MDLSQWIACIVIFASLCINIYDIGRKENDDKFFNILSIMFCSSLLTVITFSSYIEEKAVHQYISDPKSYELKIKKYYNCDSLQKGKLVIISTDTVIIKKR